MNKKIAELKLTDKTERWDESLVNDLEKSGYVVTLIYDGITSTDYIISKPMEKEQE